MGGYDRDLCSQSSRDARCHAGLQELTTRDTLCLVTVRGTVSGTPLPELLEPARLHRECLQWEQAKPNVTLDRKACTLTISVYLPSALPARRCRMGGILEHRALASGRPPPFVRCLLY